MSDSLSHARNGAMCRFVSDVKSDAMKKIAKCDRMNAPVRMRYQRGCALRHQRGVALIVVLIFTIMAFIAFSQTAGVLGHFVGARNERDLTIARQAAEAALRDAEADATCQVWSNTTRALVQTTVAGVFMVNSGARVNSNCVSSLPNCSQLMPTASAAGINLIGRQATSSGIINVGSTGVGNTNVNWNIPAGQCTDNTCAIAYGAKTGAPQIAIPDAVQVSPPKYYIEVFDVSSGGGGTPSPLFRIAALGYGASGNATVKLQEEYKPCN